jgi:hypothetical protein
MPETVADVLVRFGVDTAALRTGFRDARAQATRLATDLAQIFNSRGGVMGILGGATRTAGEVIPGGFGSFLRGLSRAISSIGSLFSGLFTRAARNVAREIRGHLRTILSDFEAGSAALGETIRHLEQERADAIRRLSGKKGGRKELDKLLPQIDESLASLRAQQKTIFEQFESQLDLLRTGAAFRDVAADVRDLVRQYRAYVDAGGDLTRANDFLSRSLEELRNRAAGELAEGEAAAIENALRLNDLLREREEILAEFAERERRIRTRGVLERRLNVAQEKSAELEALRRQRDERLAALDQEIRLAQLKVDAESRVFDLAYERIALETRLLALRARQFEHEAAQLAALRDVVQGILPGASGLFTLTPALRTELNLGGVQIFLGEGVTPAQARSAGAEVIEGMLRELRHERARLGLAV